MHEGSSDYAPSRNLTRPRNLASLIDDSTRLFHVPGSVLRSES